MTPLAMGLQPPFVTALVAAGLSLFFVRLAARVIAARRTLQVPVGDSEDRTLLRATRVHANFAEYVPITLINLGLAEMLGAPWYVVVIPGLMMIAGRLYHASGLGQEPDNFAARVRGMQLTIFALIGAAGLSALMVALRLAGIVG